MTVRGPIHAKNFKWKIIWGYRVNFWKTASFVCRLNERVEAATSNYSATRDFLQHSYSVLVGKNDRKIRSGCLFMSFPSQILFNDINHGSRATILKKKYLWPLPCYIAVVTYCYYEKVRRTMRTVIISYLLKKHTKTNGIHENPWKIMKAF